MRFTKCFYSGNGDGAGAGTAFTDQQINLIVAHAIIIIIQLIVALDKSYQWLMVVPA